MPFAACAECGGGSSSGIEDVCRAYCIAEVCRLVGRVTILETAFYSDRPRSSSGGGGVGEAEHEGDDVGGEEFLWTHAVR